jgi:tetratricopeptide (TPR) repeat protein
VARSRHRRPAPTPAPTRRPWWPIAAVVVVAGLLKLVLLLQLADHPLLQPRGDLDNAVYLELARAIAQGVPSGDLQVFFVSPFYLYFAAAALAMTGMSVFGLQLAQIALGMAAVWCIALVGRLWYGPAGGVIAGALAAATGVFAFNEILVLQSSVDAFLAALGLWLVARAWVRADRPTLVTAGLVLGLHSLNRPNIGLWAAAVVLLTLVWPTVTQAAPAAGKGSRLSSARVRAMLIAAGIALALGPVALRNFAVSGELALVSSHGGLNFYIGNHEDATGTYREVPGISPTIAGQSEDMRQVAGAALGREVTDVEASRYFYGQAWSWIAAHPGRAAMLFLRKLIYTFNATDVALNDSYTYFARDEQTVLRGLVVGPWLLVPLGLAGLVLGRPREDAALAAAWWRWTAFIGVYAVSVALFFVAGRYRLPLLAALCVTSAGSLLALWRLARAADWRPLTLAAAALAALGAVANADLGLEDGRAGWRAEAIVLQIESGRDAEAEAALALLEPEFPNPGLLRYRTARAYLARGDRARALPHLERAADLAPDRPDVRLAAGQALLAEGRAADAEPHLAAAVAADPTNALARGLRGMALGALGRPHDALVEFEQAVALDPDDASARLNLGVAYAQTGRLAEARIEAEAALRLRPGYDRARVFLDALRGRS